MIFQRDHRPWVTEASNRLRIACACAAASQREADLARLALNRHSSMADVERAVVLELLARAEAEVVAHYVSDLATVESCEVSVAVEGEPSTAELEIRALLKEALFHRDLDKRCQAISRESLEIRARARVRAALAHSPAAPAVHHEPQNHGE